MHIPSAPVPRITLVKSRLLFLFLIPVVLFVFILPAMPLMEPDEARYGDIPRIMNQTGDYVTPHLQYVEYLEKPPLSYWATALFFRIFGENDFSARLFVGLCAWGCILLAYFMGTYFHSEKTGLYSAGILSTFVMHFVLGRINTLDIPLTFFVCLATWAGYRYFAGGMQKRGFMYTLYGASALAFLTKGLIGVVFPFAIVGLWLVLSRQWREILRLFSPVGTIIFLVISCPWIILIQLANKDFLWFFFVQEHLLRYTTTMHGKANPFYYYIPVVILGTLPWLAFVPRALRYRRQNAAFSSPLSGKLFLFTWIFFVFVFFSVSSSKLIPYIAPLFIPLSVLFGHLFATVAEGAVPASEPEGKIELLTRIPVFAQSILFIIALCVPPFLKKHAVPAHEWAPFIIIPIVVMILLSILPDLVGRKLKRDWFVSVYLLSALFLGSLVFPLSQFLSPYKSAYPVVRAIEQKLPDGQELYQYGICLYGIDFYTKIRTPIVDDFGELGYGISRIAPDERKRYFLRSDSFFKICKEKGDIYCVTKYKRRVDRIRERVRNVEIIWDNGAFYLLRLRS